MRKLPPEQKTQKYYSALLLLVAVIWGGGFIATQVAIDAGFSSAFIMVVRFALAAIIFSAVFHRDVADLTAKALPSGLLCGTLLFLGFALQTVGLEFTTPSNNAFLTSTNIVLVPFLSWLLFRRRPLLKSFLGAMLCFLGVWALSWQPGAGALAFGKGEILSLLCAVSFAMHTTTLGYFACRVNVRVLNFLQLSVSALLSVLFFLATDRDFGQFRPVPAHLAVLYLAVLSTCLSYFIQTTAQKHVSASKTAVILSLEALFAAILSVALGYDPLGPGLVLGGALVLGSVILVEVDFSRAKKKADNYLT